MSDVTARIVVKTNPNKEETIKSITMDTSQILSDKSNPKTYDIVEHEPRTTRILEGVFSVCGWGVHERCLETRLEVEGDGWDTSWETLGRAMYSVSFQTDLTRCFSFITNQ